MISPLQFSHRQLILAAADHSGLFWKNSSFVGPPPVVEGEIRRLTKVLLNVNIEGSLGAVQVVMSPEKAAADLVKAAVEIYVKEKRRPLLQETDYRCFDLHYSQFSLERLKTDEKLINLGSRNFYLCKKPIGGRRS